MKASEELRASFYFIVILGIYFISYASRIGSKNTRIVLCVGRTWAKWTSRN